MRVPPWLGSAQGDHPASDRSKKTWLFVLSQKLWNTNVIAERNFTAPPSRDIGRLVWLTKLVFNDLFNLRKVGRCAFELDPFHWFRAWSYLKTVGSDKANCNFNNGCGKAEFPSPLPFFSWTLPPLQVVAQDHEMRLSCFQVWELMPPPAPAARCWQGE